MIYMAKTSVQGQNDTIAFRVFFFFLAVSWKKSNAFMIAGHRIFLESLFQRWSVKPQPLPYNPIKSKGFLWNSLIPRFLSAYSIKRIWASAA